MFLYKGQVFSGDFILSISVFLLVLVIIIPVFSQLSDQINRKNTQQELETRLLFVSESLVKTGGYPENWNKSSVQTLGLSDDDRLNITKIRLFMEMDYNETKSAMTLEGLDYRLYMTDMNGYNLYTGLSLEPVAYFAVDDTIAQSHLENSSIVWDMYFAGSSLPANSGRNVYTGTKADVFNALAANQSKYKTIIIEEPQLGYDTVDIQGIKDFVKTGGVLIFAGSADMISKNFSMTFLQASEQGVVVGNSDLLNASIGENVVFNNSQWVIANTTFEKLNAIVSSATNQSRCMICSWSYGAGKIYYISDLAAGIGSRNLTSLLLLTGKSIEKGPDLSGQNIVIVTNRHALLNKFDFDIYTAMRFFIWV